MRGTIFSTMIVLFVIPGMLYIFDTLIKKTTLGIEFYNKKIEKTHKRKAEEIY